MTDIKVVYEGPSGLTVNYDAGEPGGEVSLHGGDEQERMVLSMAGWADLADAVRSLHHLGIAESPDVRR